MSRPPVRRTKIVATLGPAWEKPEQMAAMLEAGVDVVRVNASHGTPEIRTRWIEQLRQVIDARSKPAAILVDLQGPRIRVGKLPSPVRLVPGSDIIFAPEETAVAGELPTTYRELARDARVGARVLLDDGLLAAEVIRIDGDRVHAKVIYGGDLKSNKGINLPGIDVSAPAISDKDREDVERVVNLGIDYIAISFVRRPEDLEEFRRLVPKRVKLVAKIEKDTALQNLSGILKATDAIMVARGDLGVELPFEEVPLAQKTLIRESNLHGKPVITATQMLESMIHAPRPTRAEVSDVANAILDGTDAVMLSAETAVGSYPLEAVQAMVRISREIEKQRKGHGPAFDLAVGRGRSEWQNHRLDGTESSAETANAIAVAVCAAAELLSAPLIVCFTSSGFTARTVASYRPSVPIFAVTPEPDTYRRLSLVWGVIPTLVDHFPTYDAMLPIARQKLLDLRLAQPGQRVVVTAGVPWDQAGTTNLLKIEEV